MKIHTHEVEAAIRDLNENKAAGPDKIHPRFIKHLGPKAIQELKHIFQHSWRKGACPQSWRDADIRPIAKAGKDPSTISSYRPISLTSCIGKCMERVVNNRLKYYLETNHKLSDYQAGFRSNRSVEDQLIRLSQAISDGFQNKPMLRTVLTLLDYSKAYDTVWRTGLLFKMAQLQIPTPIINWVKGWLTNRRNWVTYNNTSSDKACFREGVPQGSVISPALFLIYINDIASKIVETSEVSISLYADDVAIWAQDRNLCRAQEKVQQAITTASEWSKIWKLQLNAAKCEASFFSTYTHDSRWRPAITINDQQIAYNEHPKFLGLTFDRQLTFGKQCSITQQTAKRKTNAIMKLANTNWGYERETLKNTYIGTVRASIEYASPAWHPWLSKTNMEHLESSQRHSLRAVTGLLKTTPEEAINIEAGVPKITTRAEELSMKALEKSLRLPDNNPRKHLAKKPQNQRTKKTDWRDHSWKAWKNIFPQDHTSQFPKPVEPWKTPGSINFIVPPGRKDTTEANRLMAMEALNDNTCYDYTIYTDGSAVEGTKLGGAGIVITTGDNNNPTVVKELSLPAGKWSSSYQAEMTALTKALQETNEHYKEKKIRIVTDSKSTIDTIKGLNGTSKLKSHLDSNILNELLKCNNNHIDLTFTWCPSHCGVPGNERADDLADRGGQLNQEETKITYDTAKAVIKRATKAGREIRHERLCKIYGKQGENIKAKGKEERSLNRAEQVNISRLRSGHHPELREWRKKIGLIEEEEDSKCRLCQEEEETSIHVICHCPAVKTTRPLDWRIEDLCKRPIQTIKIWYKWKEKVARQEDVNISNNNNNNPPNL